MATPRRPTSLSVFFPAYNDSGTIASMVRLTNVYGPELTTLLLEIDGHGRVRFVEWPAEKKAIDIGSFYATSAKFAGVTGWRPAVTLRDGLAKTIACYRQHFDKYVPAASAP